MSDSGSTRLVGLKMDNAKKNRTKEEINEVKIVKRALDYRPLKKSRSNFLPDATQTIRKTVKETSRTWKMRMPRLKKWIREELRIPQGTLRHSSKKI